MDSTNNNRGGQTGAAFRNEYAARINRVLDYIEKNIDHPLSLEQLAEVANFSRFHFHRIFRAFIGEPLNRFILRIRVEKAAAKLLANPKDSITDIALDCGFSGSAVFARSFRDFFGLSPSRWKAEQLKKSKISIVESNPGHPPRKIRQDFNPPSWYIDPVTKKITWRINMKHNVDLKHDDKKNEGMKPDVNIGIVDAPDYTVAYVRHIGPYKGDSELFGALFARLMNWMAPRELMSQPDLKCMAVYHDNPDITDPDKLRISLCMTIPPQTPVDGEIGKMTIPGGKYAVGHFELDANQFEAAWNTLCAEWLPESGFQPDDRPCFEMFLNDPKQHPQGKHLVDIHIPVRLMP